MSGIKSVMETGAIIKEVEIKEFENKSSLILECEKFGKILRTNKSLKIRNFI